MDSARAVEILNSPETIYVTYRNMPVWIDAVNDNHQARIRDMNSNNIMEVPVEDLTEVGT